MLLVGWNEQQYRRIKMCAGYIWGIEQFGVEAYKVSGEAKEGVQTGHVDWAAVKEPAVQVLMC